MISARTQAAKNTIVTPRHRAPNGPHHPHTSHSPPKDHSEATAASLTQNWAFATAQGQQPPTLNPTVQKMLDPNTNHPETRGQHRIPYGYLTYVTNE